MFKGRKTCIMPNLLETLDMQLCRICRWSFILTNIWCHLCTYTATSWFVRRWYLLQSICTTNSVFRELKLRNYTPEDEELKERQVPKAKPASGKNLWTANKLWKKPKLIISFNWFLSVVTSSVILTSYHLWLNLIDLQLKIRWKSS